MDDTKLSNRIEHFLHESTMIPFTFPFTVNVEFSHLNKYATLFISASSTTKLGLFFWYSMIHFLPSLVNTGGLTAAAAGAATAFAAAGIGMGALNGAGPVRSVEFLWVCMSAVTFFKPVGEKHFSNYNKLQ